MTINTNYNTENEGQVNGKPTPDETKSTAELPFISNYMMALLNSIQQTTDNIYKQQAVDAKTLTMLQEYMQAVQKNQGDAINTFIRTHSDDYTNEVAAQVSQMQAQMSAEVEKANSAVGSMKSTLSNDINNASQILNFFDGLTTITGQTTRLLG
jgi:hypothetical protein